VVKEPWWHSNHFEALRQMLLTNQHLDKLAVAHVDFTEYSMLKGISLSSVLDQICSMNFYCIIWLFFELTIFVAIRDD
jgi:hypothetical protein